MPTMANFDAQYATYPYTPICAAARVAKRGRHDGGIASEKCTLMPEDLSQTWT